MYTFSYYALSESNFLAPRGNQTTPGRRFYKIIGIKD